MEGKSGRKPFLYQRSLKRETIGHTPTSSAPPPPTTSTPGVVGIATLCGIYPLPQFIMTTATMNATQLLSYFVSKTRDGSHERFWCLSDSAPECVQALVRDCHGDELPNDWRYNVIVNILFELKNGNDVTGEIGVDAYNSDLIDWLTVSRLAFLEECKEEDLFGVDNSIVGLIQAGQYIITDQMICEIKAFLDLDD